MCAVGNHAGRRLSLQFTRALTMVKRRPDADRALVSK
jgi:hypothetical protein